MSTEKLFYFYNGLKACPVMKTNWNTKVLFAGQYQREGGERDGA